MGAWESGPRPGARWRRPGDERAPPGADPETVAEEAGLRYVSDAEPGIRRRRRGRGFSYRNPDGGPVSDAQRARIEALAIPPAWQDVWICPRGNGHLQATGRDARGRKQYRYHDTWRSVRDADKFSRLLEFGETCVAALQGRRGSGRPGTSREQVLAAVVRLLDETLVRVGNEEYADANDSYGLTTLRPEHVEDRALGFLAPVRGQERRGARPHGSGSQAGPTGAPLPRVGWPGPLQLPRRRRSAREHLVDRREPVPPRARRAADHGQGLPDLGSERGW